MPTRLTIARLAATHPIDLRCTQDDCSAMVVGPLPEEWLADPDTGDVLCPQHRAQAVWFDYRAPVAVDPSLCLRLAAECTEDDARMSPAPWLAEHDTLYSEGDGTIQLAEFTGEAMVEDDAAVARVRNNLPVIIAQLRAAAGIAPSLDGIDQGTSAPTAILRETSDPRRPGLIGDETLNGSRGRR